MCHVESGILTHKEHEAARWLTKEQLASVAWLPADRKVVETLKSNGGIKSKKINNDGQREQADTL